MQFGIGILGAGWSIELATKTALSNTLPPHPNFHLHAGRYAGKIAKQTILSEHYSLPDLSDDGIVRASAGCARSVRPSEASMVREAFIQDYGSYMEAAA
jgi:hypothetical protein